MMTNGLDNESPFFRKRAELSFFPRALFFFCNFFFSLIDFRHKEIERTIVYIVNKRVFELGDWMTA